MRSFFYVALLFFNVCLFGSNFLLNSDFESWSDSTHPNSWYADSTYPDSFKCVQSSTRYSGNYSFIAKVYTKVQSLTDVVSEFVSVQPSSVYRIKAYILDNEPVMYSKPYLNYYDASYAFISNNFLLDSVGDSPSWQMFPETIVTTPSTAAYARVGFRFYDISALWDGDGFIYIDSVCFGDTLSGGASNTPPQFSGLSHAPSIPSAFEKTTVSCNITDNVSISADTMFYRVDYGSWMKVVKDSLSGDKRFYTIPGQSSFSFVQYYVWAIDNEGASSTSSTNSYTVGGSSSVEIKKVLFDLTKNQTAGNADWKIDNNWPVPSPSNPTQETDWYGGISSWGFELDTARIYNSQRGDTIKFEVYTLHPDSPITYGTSRPMDLKNYDVYIVCEPQNLFTSAESTAIYSFVSNGGGLFMVADHVSSDRDGDGWDSPKIWDAFGSDLFGMHFYQVGEGYNNLSVSTSSYDTANDTLVNGPFGSVIGGTYNFHAGTMIQKSSQALEVAIYNTDYSMFSIALYGSHNGRVAGTGDSSPCDDGTGQSGDELYDGWNEGIDRRLILNATYWLSIDSLDYSSSSAVDALYNSNGNSITISLNIDNYSSYNFISISRKLKNDNDFLKISSFIPSNRIVSVDSLPLSYSGIVSYRVTGTAYKTEELALFDVYVKTSFNRSLTFFASSDYISGDFHGAYNVSDVSGRTFKKVAVNGRIQIRDLKQGVYFFESEISKDKIKIVRLK